MSREAALLVMVGVALVLIALMGWGWRRRTRRDARLVAPHGALPQGTPARVVSSGFYVATTAHEQPLERLAIRGLAFRSRVVVTVADAGVALDLTGEPEVLLDRARLVDAGRATVAIDRVVESGGLARITWRADDGTLVDSYLRPQDATAQALVDAVRSLLPSPAPTGGDA